MKENDQFDIQQKQLKKSLKAKEKKESEEEHKQLIKKFEDEIEDASPEEQEKIRARAADVIKKGRSTNKFDKEQASVTERRIKIMEAKKQELGDVLKSTIMDHIKGKPKAIKDKGMDNLLLDTLPEGVNISEKGSPWLIRDKVPSYPSFIAVLYCGLDFKVLLLMIQLFTGLNMYIENTMITMLVVYLLEKILQWARARWGEKNVSRKSLTNDCFLI